jgi:biopolymer transport protein ExbD
MAEIQESSGKGDKGGKVRSKKAGGKPDMTPMVDLGFLLITFFMFTTTFSKPNILPLTMPMKEDEPNVKPPEIKESNTITILMGKDDRIFWYQAAAAKVTEADLHETDYSTQGIRSQIVDKKNRALDKAKFTVIIKPTDDANFKNTVDILDEMEITGNKQYAIVDLMESDKTAYAAKILTPKKVE